MGREKKEKQRRLNVMALEVRRIIEEATKPKFSKGSLQNLTKIGRTDSDGTRVMTRIKAKHNLKWGSVKSQLVSLGHFIKFLKVSEDADDPRQGWPDNTIQMMETVQARCFTSISKLHTIEYHERKRLQLGTEIQPLQFAHILGSDRMAQTLSFFFMFRPLTERLDPQLYTKNLNRLLICVQLTNGKRSGVLADLRKSEVDNDRLVDGIRVALVSSGKTLKSYGPSKVVFSEEIYRSVRALCEKEYAFITLHRLHGIGSRCRNYYCFTVKYNIYKEFLYNL